MPFSICVDFADDPVLRTKAEMFLNLYQAAAAGETIASSRGGGKMRVKNEHLYMPFVSRGYDVLFRRAGPHVQPSLGELPLFQQLLSARRGVSASRGT